jgi:hypothetical protein
MSEISRRRMLAGSLVLLGAAGGAVLGTSRSVHHKVALPPPPPPAALTAALARQQALLAGYDAVIAIGAGPAALPGLREDSAAHVDALRAALEQYPGWRLQSASPRPTTSAGLAPTAPAVARTMTALLAQLAGTRDAAGAACLAWPATEVHADQVVPLLGSMAACLSTHADVLA